MAATQRIVEAAMKLRSHAPEEWENFVMAMREYAAATTSDMISCPPELLLRAQGMAFTANDISSTLRNVQKLYERQRNG